MDRRPVASSMIRSWGYDATVGALELEFTNGRIYRYADVPRFLADGFAVARSKGQFFLSRIEGRYTASEVR